MRKFLALTNIGVQNTFAYRGPIVFWLLGNIASLVMMIAVWLAANTGATLGGYTKNELITYYIISLLLQWIIGWYPAEWVSEKIKNGEIIADGLLKPISYYIWAFGTDLGWHLVAVPFGLLVSLIFAQVFSANFVLTLNWPLLMIIVLACIFSIIITFTIQMSLSYLAFWITEASMAFEVFWATMGLFGGHFMPLSFFPHSTWQIISLLPFRYMFSFPLELYFHRLDSQGIVLGFFGQVVWIGIAVVIYKFMWHKGVKVYNAWGQ